MPIVIKKRVSLEFLGEDYKNSYIVVKSVGVGEFKEIGPKTVKNVVIERFIEGEIYQDGGNIQITKDNIEELPGEVFTEAFAYMTGKIDPKLEGLSSNQSQMTAPLL